ncbi:MAG: flippase [Cetobacterium sp.]
MKTEKIHINIFYNLILQVFNMAFPFLTASYVSRVLGPTNLGIINYSQSISAWAIVFATFGIQTYGIREISNVRDSLKNKKIVFIELFFIKFIASLFTLSIYFLIIFFNPFFKMELNLYIITSFSLFFNIFNVDWYFGGIENYKILSLRNIAVKLITFFLIVLLVKEKKDYIIYAILLILGQGLSQIWSFLIIKFEYKKKIFFKSINLRKHFKNLIVFFISALVVSIYNILNGIILGFYANSEKIAFFTRARAFQSMGLAIISSIIIVLTPRISYYYTTDREKYDNLLYNSLDYIYLLSLPLALGIYVFSDILNIIFGGIEFLGAAKSLRILTPLIVIVSIGLWTWTQIVLPLKKEKIGTFIQSIMAIFGLITTIVFSKKYQDVGASYALLLTETLGVIITFFILRSHIKIKLITNSFVKSVVACIFMFGILFILKKRLGSLGEVCVLLIGIIVGILSYVIILICLKEKKIIDLFYKMRGVKWIK